MPVVRANQVRFHYEYIGSFQEGAPTLVCLHGFTGTLHTFDTLCCHYLRFDIFHQ